MTSIATHFQDRQIFLLLWMCLLLITMGVDAQIERELPRMSATRTSEAIKIDGVLDERVWQSVAPIRELYQIQPDQGAAATEPSEVRILYDDKKLYFGFIFFDSEMDKVVANEMRRDSEGLRSNDYGFLLLDPYNDQRNAVFFRFNPVGGIEDTAVSNSGGSRNQSWDIVFECRCRMDVRLTDSDVILARSDVAASRPTSGNYINTLSIEKLGLQVKRGYAAVDATVLGRMYRSVNTHLEAYTEEAVRVSQMRELVDHLSDETLPILVLGQLPKPKDLGL